MNEFSAKDIVKIYEKLVRKASASYAKNQVNITYKFIKASAKWAYGFNFIFSDIRLEKLIHSLGAEMIPKREVKHNVGERYVLLDTCSEDNRGLHQQYLRAFENAEASYLFITLRKDLDPLKKTIEDISSYNKGSFWHDESNESNPYTKAKIISDVIFDYAPNRVFLHIMPSDIISLMAIDSICGSTKYNINFTDHAFWLGSSFVDYNIEFRGCGRTISLEKRNFSESQLINLPFYPIIQNNNRKDELPPRANNDVVIFTGGAPYKMIGDNGFFFNTIIDRLLSLSPNIKVWVAGFDTSNSLFKDLTSEMKNADRVFNIGVRKDINHVFQECDIYLGTYPVGGGLMTQYAAINGKPILSYLDINSSVIFNMDGIVNQCAESMHSYVSIDDFLNYAQRLILDKEYRAREGNNNKNAIMSKEKFNSLFQKTILKKENILTWKEPKIDYEIIFEKYIEIENEGAHHNVVELVSVLKLSSLLLFWNHFPILLPVMWKSAKKYSFDLKKL